MKTILALILMSLMSSPVLAVGETTILVYRGKHKMVGHEFAEGGSQGVPFKIQDDIWLVIEVDVDTWQVLNAHTLYYWKATNGGYEGDSMPVHNLRLVVDEVSSRKVGTLFSTDLNNDHGGAPSPDPSDKDIVVLQGSMKVTFTGAASYLVATSLKGYAIGMWDWSDDAVTYNDIAAGPMAIKFDKNYSIAANQPGGAWLSRRGQQDQGRPDSEERRCVLAKTLAALEPTGRIYERMVGWVG